MYLYIKYQRKIYVINHWIDQNYFIIAIAIICLYFVILFNIEMFFFKFMLICIYNIGHLLRNIGY